MANNKILTNLDVKNIISDYTYISGERKRCPTSALVINSLPHGSTDKYASITTKSSSGNIEVSGNTAATSKRCITDVSYQIRSFRISITYKNDVHSSTEEWKLYGSSYTIVPATISGMVLESVKVDGVVISSPYTITNITSNKTVVLEYSAASSNTYTVVFNDADCDTMVSESVEENKTLKSNQIPTSVRNTNFKLRRWVKAVDKTTTVDESLIISESEVDNGELIACPELVEDSVWLPVVAVSFDGSTYSDIADEAKNNSRCLITVVTEDNPNTSTSTQEESTCTIEIPAKNTNIKSLLSSITMDEETLGAYYIGSGNLTGFIITDINTAYSNSNGNYIGIEFSTDTNDNLSCQFKNYGNISNYFGSSNNRGLSMLSSFVAGSNLKSEIMCMLCEYLGIGGVTHKIIKLNCEAPSITCELACIFRNSNHSAFIPKDNGYDGSYALSDNPGLIFDSTNDTPTRLTIVTNNKVTISHLYVDPGIWVRENNSENCTIQFILTITGGPQSTDEYCKFQIADIYTQSVPNTTESEIPLKVYSSLPVPPLSPLVDVKYHFVNSQGQSVAEFIGKPVEISLIKWK